MYIFQLKKPGTGTDPVAAVGLRRSGIDLWLSESIRPEWGIHRSLDDSGRLKDTYLQIRNLKADKL